MRRSVGVVSLLSVKPRTDSATVERQPLVATATQLQQCDEEALKEDTPEEIENKDSGDESSVSNDSDVSIEALLKTPDDKQSPPLTPISQNVSAAVTSSPSVISTPSVASCKPAVRSPATRKYKTPSRSFDCSKINYDALSMSVSPEDLSTVTQCELERPLSYRAIVSVHLSFVIDLPSHMVLPREEEPSDRDARDVKARRPQSLVRTPSRVIRALSRGSRSCDDEDSSGDRCPPVTSRESQLRRLQNLSQVVAYLREDNRLLTKCLFRIPGSVLRVRDLTQRLAKTEGNTHIALGEFTVHDVACALKSTLTSLSPFLIPEDLHPLFAQVVRLTEPRTDEHGVVIPFAQGDLELLQTKQLRALRLLLLLLDGTCRSFLSDLFDCLKRVSSCQSVTCINDYSLGVLFGPVLFRSDSLQTTSTPTTSHEDIFIYNQVVELLLSWHPSVFEVPLCVLEPMKRALASSDNDLEHATCVSYVQRGKREQTSITEYALSELYAHIASMPESAKKRRFVKQVSNRNGGIVELDSPSVAHVERAQAESARQMQCL